MWLLFALTSAFFYAAAGMVVRYSVDKNVRDPRGVIAIHAFGALLVGVVVWLVTGAKTIPAAEAIWPLLSGVLCWMGAIGYLRAYTIDDASNVVILQQMQLPLTIILGFVILGDSMTGRQLAAVAVILFGVLLASKTHKGFHLRNKWTFIYILFSAFCWAGMALLGRHSAQKYDIFAYNLYLMISYSLFSFLQSALHPSTKSGLIDNLRPFSHRIVWVIVFSEVVFTVATLTQLKAFSSVSAGLVVSVGSSEIFFSIIIGTIMTKLLPHMIKETIDRRTLALKICGGIVACGGIALLNK
jgi:transporter family protein